MDQEHISLWTSSATHGLAFVYCLTMILRPNTRNREKVIFAVSSGLFITALYNLALAMDQGIHERLDGVQVRWARWAGSIIVEALFAYSASRVLVQSMNTRIFLIGIVVSLVSTLLIITFSTGYRMWVWFGIAVFQLGVSSYMFIGYYTANIKTVRFGFPIAYGLYGLFFLLGHCMTGVLDVWVETWIYTSLDIVTKAMFWIYVLHKIEIPEKIESNTLGAYAERYDIHVS